MVNTKFEIRNTKQIQMFQYQNSKQLFGPCFEHWNFEFLICFGPPWRDCKKIELVAKEWPKYFSGNNATGNPGLGQGFSIFGLRIWIKIN